MFRLLIATLVCVFTLSCNKKAPTPENKPAPQKLSLPTTTPAPQGDPLRGLRAIPHDAELVISLSMPQVVSAFRQICSSFKSLLPAEFRGSSDQLLAFAKERYGIDWLKVPHLYFWVRETGRDVVCFAVDSDAVVKGLYKKISDPTGAIYDHAKKRRIKLVQQGRWAVFCEKRFSAEVAIQVAKGTTRGLHADSAALATFSTLQRALPFQQHLVWIKSRKLFRRGPLVALNGVYVVFGADFSRGVAAAALLKKGQMDESLQQITGLLNKMKASWTQLEPELQKQAARFSAFGVSGADIKALGQQLNGIQIQAKGDRAMLQLRYPLVKLSKFLVTLFLLPGNERQRPKTSTNLPTTVQPLPKRPEPITPAKK